MEQGFFFRFFTPLARHESRAARRLLAATLVVGLLLLNPIFVGRAAQPDAPPDRSAVAGLATSLGLVGATALVDEPLYNAVRSTSSPERRAFFRTVTHLGDGLASLAVTGALWFYDPETATLVGRASVRSGIATMVLKAIISRGRPWEDPAFCGNYRVSVRTCGSMPSGHTATAFSMARVLADRYPETAWLWYGLATLVGWSRVETNFHWPSDVVAGALLGLWVADSVLKQSQDTDESTTGDEAGAVE